MLLSTDDATGLMMALEDDAEVERASNKTPFDERDDDEEEEDGSMPS